MTHSLFRSFSRASDRVASPKKSPRHLQQQQQQPPSLTIHPFTHPRTRTTFRLDNKDDLFSFFVLHWGVVLAVCCLTLRLRHSRQ